MAAIAYVTDEKMLDYFRMNGINSVVFWRLSSKNFSDFKPGDLLFFLSKATGSKRSNEKGIVGYGCYMKKHYLSIETIWKKYETKTGYSSKQELFDAIEKNCKTTEIPDKITCLQLENVTFFQNPIYLSDLGYKISNKLESFTYLDKNEGNQTLKILEEARNVGLDLWSATIGSGDEEMFNHQLIKYQIATVLEEMNIENSVHHSEEIIKTYGNKQSMWLNQQRYAFMNFEPVKHIYYIFESSPKLLKDNYYRMIGYLSYLKEILFDMFDDEVVFTVISNSKLNDVQINLLKKNDISYIERNLKN